MVDDQGRRRRREAREGGKRDVLSGGRLGVEGPQNLRVLPILRRHFHDDVILVQGRVHGRNLALAEGVVERIVDILRRQAQARGGVPVDGELRRLAVILLVGV